MKTLISKNFVPICLAIASFILALAPIRWLVTTWFDPSYQSTGGIYLIAIVALVIWSSTSPSTGKTAQNRQMAVALLIISALIRVMSQVLAINIIGGIALALDVFAILTLLNLSGRKRAVSAFWVSVLFLFTLPFERVLQRLLGYPMQELSAAGTCQLLGTYYEDLACNGVRIRLAAQDVLVDLPCSGTTSLMLAAAFLVCLNAIHRPKFLTALLWGLITIGLSIVGNILRITLLAIGLVNPKIFFGIDVMAQPAHDLIGYATIGFSLLPLVLLYKPRPAARRVWKMPLSVTVPNWLQRASALGFVALVLTVISLPARPLDISSSLAAIEMPSNLLGYKAMQEPLEAVERQYFEQYGGQAQKARFGPLALTLVQTSSPLRHLHSPEDCLRGLGYDVNFIGTRFEPVPTALYRATGPTGDQWNVAVTFTTSADGAVFATSNVAEAIWYWLKNPGSRWSSIQRVTPWTMGDTERRNLEAAVISALDITPSIQKGDVL